MGSALYQIGTHVALSLGANISAIVLSLPVLVLLAVLAHFAGSLSIVPLGIVLFVAVLPNPMLAGLQTSSRSLLTGNHVSLRDTWLGLRTHWKTAALTWAVAVPITGAILLNVAFYGGLISGHRPLGTVSGPLEILWLALLFFWISLHLYVFPLLIAQEQPAALLAYRNAAVIVLSRPLFTVIVEAVWLAFLVLAAATGLAVILGLMLGAAIQEAAFLRILPTLTPRSRIGREE